MAAGAETLCRPADVSEHASCLRRQTLQRNALRVEWRFVERAGDQDRPAVHPGRESVVVRRRRHRLAGIASGAVDRKRVRRSPGRIARSGRTPTMAIKQSVATLTSPRTRHQKGRSGRPCLSRRSSSVMRLSSRRRSRCLPRTDSVSSASRSFRTIRKVTPRTNTLPVIGPATPSATRSPRKRSTFSFAMQTFRLAIRRRTPATRLPGR